MSTPASMYQDDSALNQFVRLVLALLIIGIVAIGLYATSAGRPHQAAADSLQVARAATNPPEQPVSPPPFTGQGNAMGGDSRQETALTVLLLIAIANARAQREPDRDARQQAEADRVQ